ncbi:MAG: insulinase family protein [Myxococcota bacterium]
MKLSSAALSFLLALTACSASFSASTAKPDSTDAKPPAAATDDAKTPSSPALPADPAVRVGTLENGLTYYIRKHETPKQRAALWLAVDAGSVLEDDDQQGLAHFVEHMAFNGTERFEKNTLIDYIEKSGMDFGADLNAYTSFDETVYQLTVPTDDAESVSRGFDILEDWASAISFDPEEVDKERGVVIEEWRLGRGASQRVFDQQMPIYLEGSKYAERKPIGKKKILETAPVDTLKRFYKDWYRPDLMAVIVVGDLEPDQVEQEIKARFGKLTNPENARPRPDVEVPLLDKTRAAVVTDPEAPRTQVSVAIKRPASKMRTEDDFKNELVNDLFQGMLRARLDEIRQSPDSPYMFAFTFTNTMGRNTDIFQMFSMAKSGQSEAALNTLLTEVARVEKHGFLQSEFDRQKADVLRDYEKSAAEDDKIKGRSHAFRIVQSFLNDEALPGAQQKLDLAKRMMPSVTLDDVNAFAAKWTSSKDRVVMASGPAREKMPEEKALLAIVDQVNKADIQPYTEEAAATTLMAAIPEPGTITKKKKLDEIGAAEWTLSNGVKVIVKPTDFKNDEVLMTAFSPGGTSVVTDKQFESARYAASVASAGGVGEFDAVALRKSLQGKDVFVRPFVSELEEGMRGSGSPQDLETMMQLIHLSFTSPRADKKAFEAFKESQREFVRNRDLNPQSVFFERLSSETSSNHKRRRMVTLEDVDKVQLDQAMKIYEDRFADASDFTFVFVGNVDKQQLRKLSKTYLATLPTKKRRETWKDVGARKPRGVKTFTVNKGQDPKSFVMMTFHGNAKWTAEAEDDIEMLADVMGIRLREVLREEMGGVYGAFSFGNISRRPKAEYTYTIGFGCAPENVAKLKKAVFKIIDEVKTEGVSSENIDKVKETRRRQMETKLKENRFWLRELAEHYRYGTDATKIGDPEKATKRVSSENVQRAAKRYFNTKRYIDGVLMPEGDAKPSGTALKTK